MKMWIRMGIYQTLELPNDLDSEAYCKIIGELNAALENLGWRITRSKRDLIPQLGPVTNTWDTTTVNG